MNEVTRLRDLKTSKEYNLGGSSKLYKHTVSLIYDPSEGLGYETITLKYKWLSTNNTPITLKDLHQYISENERVQLNFNPDSSIFEIGEGIVEDIGPTYISVMGYTIYNTTISQRVLFIENYEVEASMITFTDTVTEL